MGTRKIKDGKVDGEKVYFKGHAQATYMSDGRTVEDAISEVLSNDEIYYLDCGVNVGLMEGTLDLSEWDKIISAKVIILRRGYVAYVSHLKTVAPFGDVSAMFIINHTSGSIGRYVVEIQKTTNSITWSVSEKIIVMNAYTKYNMDADETTYTLNSNRLYIWDEVASLDLSFAEEIPDVVNEYTFQFTSGATPTSITLPDTIQWANGEPSFEANKTYQVSIVNNIGLIVSV